MIVRTDFEVTNVREVVAYKKNRSLVTSRVRLSVMSGLDYGFLPCDLCFVPAAGDVLFS